MKLKYHGHYPGHLREQFQTALNNFSAIEFPDGNCAVEEDDDVPLTKEQIRSEMNRMCGIMWHCSDYMPGIIVDMCSEFSYEFDFDKYYNCSTYSSAAQFIRYYIKNT